MRPGVGAFYNVSGRKICEFHFASENQDSAINILARFHSFSSLFVNDNSQLFHRCKDHVLLNPRVYATPKAPSTLVENFHLESMVLEVSVFTCVPP